MKRHKPIFKEINKRKDEQAAWLYLTPAQRFQQTTKLWQLYLALGGKLEPELDPQSPFYFLYKGNCRAPKRY